MVKIGRVSAATGCGNRVDGLAVNRFQTFLLNYENFVPMGLLTRWINPHVPAEIMPPPRALIFPIAAVILYGGLPDCVGQENGAAEEDEQQEEEGEKFAELCRCFFPFQSVMLWSHVSPSPPLPAARAVFVSCGLSIPGRAYSSGRSR